MFFVAGLFFNHPTLAASPLLLIILSFPFSAKSRFFPSGFRVTYISFPYLFVVVYADFVTPLDPSFITTPGECQGRLKL